MMVRREHSDRLPARLLANFLEAPSDQFKCLFPSRRHKLPVFAYQGLGKPVFVMGKVERITPLDAEKIAVNAALVAIISAHDLHPRLGAPHAQRGLASVRAVCAG